MMRSKKGVARRCVAFGLGFAAVHAVQRIGVTRHVQAVVRAAGQHIKTVILILLCPTDIAGHEAEALAMLAVGINGALQGIEISWIIILAGNTEEVGEIKMANPEHVDAIDGGNAFDLSQTKLRFDLGNQQIVFVAFLAIFPFPVLRVLRQTLMLALPSMII